MRSVAVAIVHGVGRPGANFADGMIARLRSQFRRNTGADPSVLAFQPVYWAPVLQNAENTLWGRLAEGGPLDFKKLRRFMVDFAADAVAYQPSPREKSAYEAVHSVLADALKGLGTAAGPTAPLCVIAHSLGTIIASNFIYDLQSDAGRGLIAPSVRRAMGDTPLDRGETLSSFYTLGSPLALWSLRYKDFGQPVRVPDPRLSRHHPGLGGEWMNIYDRDDVLGYPLKTVNAAYGGAVTEDLAVNAGGFLASWNPAAHTEYWEDRDVIKRIASGLSDLWRRANTDGEGDKMRKDSL